MAINNMFVAFFGFCIAIGSASVFSTGREVSRENIRKLALAHNELATNLYQRIAAGSSDNVFFSPLSISTAFGMLLYGARGSTAEELREALGYEKANLTNDCVHEAFSDFLEEVLRSDESSDGYVLNAANAILVDKRLELLKEYRHHVQELYKAAVKDVDFVREAPRIVGEINDWVKEKTNGKIEKLLDELSSSTVLVLLNAVYFKGTWKFEFDKEKTRDGIFYNYGLDSQEKKLPMMHMKEKLPYTVFEDFQALELPYKGENVSMLILLPQRRDGLQSLEGNLTSEKLIEVQSRLYPIKVEVSLPKFKLEYEGELSEQLKALGAQEIFSGGSADFSGLTLNRDVSVSQVLHKAVIEVNEEGSEAAAVTAILSFRMRRPEIIADHPFLFAVVEKGSNAILFMGRVNNL